MFMYIRETITPTGEKYLHLVESTREGGKVKQKIILSLGKESDRTDEQLMNLLAKRRKLTTLDGVIDSLTIQKSYHYGPLYVLEKLFKKFGIGSALDGAAKAHPKLQFDFEKAVFSMIVGRFIRPGSKLQIYDDMMDSFYPGLFQSDLKLQHFYRALDILADNKEAIESQILKYNNRNKNISTDVLLYDLTTLRFESTQTENGELAKYGYSKEKRSDCTQVILGLVVDTEGIPLFFDIFPGNTYEGSTIAAISEKLKQRFNVRRFILVADRGLFSKGNLEEIQKSEDIDVAELDQLPFEYIVGLKMAALKKNSTDFYNFKNYTRINEEFAFYETEYEGRRCILTWSKVRSERDKKVRQDIINKLQKKLGKKTNPSDFVSNTNYKKYIKGLDGGEDLTINQQAIDNEEKRDGYFGVITNIKKTTYSAQEITAQYKNLWIVEDAFGEIKGTLRARPIFHWTDHRIKGHLTMCYLAYFCEAQITKTFRHKKLMLESKSIDNGEMELRALTSVQFMKSLNSLRAIEITIADKTLIKTTPIDNITLKGLAALSIPLPEKTLKAIL